MQHKVIVVSGGAGGIGAEVALRSRSEGARVVIADLNASQAEAKAAGIRTQGGQAFGAACDITDPEECEAVAQIAVERFGQLDGVVRLRRNQQTA